MPLPLLALLALGGAGVLGGAAAVGASRRSSGTALPIEEGEADDPEGGFSSFLRYLSRPGKVVNNLAMGNFEGAGRQAVDILGDTVDSVLPGNWIPSLSRKQDFPEFSDVAGGMEPGWGKTAVDILGGIATDPLTFLPPAWLAKGAGVASKVVGGAAKGAGMAVAPELTAAAGKKLAAAGRGFRSVIGAPRLTPENEALLRAGEAAGSTTSAAQVAAAKAYLEKGADPELRKVAFQIVENMKDVPGGGKAVLLPDSEVAALSQMPANGLDLAAPVVKSAPIADPLTAGQVFKQVRKPSERIPNADPLDALLGIKGVAGDDAANAAAQRVMAEAYPPVATSDGFASGIKLANKDFFTGDVLKELDQIPRTLPGEKSLGAPVRGVRPEGLPSPDVPYLDLPPGKPGMPTKGPLQDMKLPVGDTFDTIEGHLERFGKRADEAVRQGMISPEQKASLMAMFAERLPVIQNQFREAVEKGAMQRPIGRDLLREMPADYVQRQFSGIDLGEGNLSSGVAKSQRGRTLKEGESLPSFLNDPENAGVKLTEDIAKADLERAAQQGDMVKRATIGKGLIERYAESAAAKQQQAIGKGVAELSPAEKAAVEARYKALNEPEAGAAITKILEDMRGAGQIEDANTLQTAIQGMAPRGALMSAIAKGNSFFKKAAVYGYIIPKVGSDVRNAISGVWQAAANPESRSVALGQLKRLHKTIGGSIAESLGFKWDDAARDLELVDQALSKSGGLADEAARQLPDDLGKLWKAGLFDGYTTSEQLIGDMAKTGWKKTYSKVADWPGRIFKGIEDRMRLGMAKDLMAQGKSAEDAVRITGDSLFRYNVNSVGNRTARDLIPFFQFQAKAIPQAAKFLSEPSMAGNLARSSISHLYDQSQGQVYPWMEGNLNIPIGNDTEGKPEFVSGFGLPFEALSAIPNPSASPRQFGRQVERGVVASMSPPIKTVYGLVSGEDPYSGQPFASYDKIPVVGSAGSTGRAYNALAGTGAIQPVASVLQSLGKITDPRRDVGIRALDMLTGANVQSVDPDRAEQMRITEILKQNPAVRQFTGFYQQGSDPDIVAQLGDLKQLTKKTKKEARDRQDGPEARIPEDVQKAQEKIRAKRGRDKNGNIVGLKDSP